MAISRGCTESCWLLACTRMYLVLEASSLCRRKLRQVGGLRHLLFFVAPVREGAAGGIAESGQQFPHPGAAGHDLFYQRFQLSPASFAPCRRNFAGDIAHGPD